MLKIIQDYNHKLSQKICSKLAAEEWYAKGVKESREEMRQRFAKERNGEH